MPKRAAVRNGAGSFSTKGHNGVVRRHRSVIPVTYGLRQSIEQRAFWRERGAPPNGCVIRTIVSFRRRISGDCRFSRRNPTAIRPVYLDLPEPVRYKHFASWHHEHAPIERLNFDVARIANRRERIPRRSARIEFVEKRGLQIVVLLPIHRTDRKSTRLNSSHLVISY